MPVRYFVLRARSTRRHVRPCRTPSRSPLEQAIQANIIPSGCDQFNSLHERLVEALKNFGINSKLHLTSCKGYAEDEATVRYLEECAIQAGIETNFIYLEDIGQDDAGALVDLDDEDISTLFKLFMT